MKKSKTIKLSHAAIEEALGASPSSRISDSYRDFSLTAKRGKRKYTLQITAFNFTKGEIAKSSTVDLPEGSDKKAISGAIHMLLMEFAGGGDPQPSWSRLPDECSPLISTIQSPRATLTISPSAKT